MANRFPLPIRVLCFAFGLAALYLLYWARTDELYQHMVLQTELSMGGAAIMTFSVAFWSKVETAWRYKLLITGTTVFLVGVTWIMGIGEGPYPFPSFPSFLFFSSIALGLSTLTLPNRHFVSAR